MEKYRYCAFSLCLESEILLPELTPHDGEYIDVQIAWTPHPTFAEASAGKQVRGDSSDIDFHIPGVGHFYVHAGKHIWVHPDKNSSLDQIRLFILGSSMGAILHQRGRLVLHGNAIEIGGKCSVFVGPSGNGKSTLAGAFIKQGYRVLTDDVCAITFQNGLPHVSPGYPQIKLWRDSAEILGQDPSKLNSIYDRAEKFALPVHDFFVHKSLPIDQIIVLNTWEKQHIELKRITGAQQFQAIFENTYRQNFMRRIGQDPNYFELCNQLARKTPVFSLTRPKTPYRLDELISTVLNRQEAQQYCEPAQHQVPA